METSAVNLREYNKIYTGTNQQTGYENPFFGFTSDTSELILEKDKITYFHYPITAPSATLLNSSLVADGAIAGETPYASDKIWKKQANYSSTTIWGNSQPIGKQTGVWLCSWLSGSMVNNTTPVWKDRWYNPGYIDPSSALFVTNPITSSILVDIDSEMTFEGGSYYKYFHVGDTHNTTLINNLTSSNHLKLYLEDWSQSPIDLSNNNNISKIQYFYDTCVSYNGINILERPLDTCLNLNGKNYCETLYSSSISLTGDLSYNIWAQSDDWNMGNNTILSKDNRGGYCLKIDQGFNDLFMVFFDDIGKMALVNNEGHVINSNTLPQPSKPTSMALDTNHYTWVSDNSAKKVYKIDYNGDILTSIDFEGNVGLNAITIDDADRLWVLDNSNYRLSAFNIVTNNICSAMDVSISNNFTFDLNATLYTTSGTQILADNNNDIWTVENNKVYKNATFMISGDNIGIDKDNNLWVLFDTNSYLKMNTTTFDYISGTIGTNLTPTTRNIDFMHELNNGAWETFVYFTFANEQKIYKTDLTGKFIKTIDLSLFDLYPNLSHYSSYDWNRKFNYMKYDQTPQIKADIFIKNGTAIEKYTLTTPVNEFNDQNWHMFTYTYDKNNLKFYIDSVLKDSYTIGSNTSIYYAYENSLMLGANTGKNDTLSKECLVIPNYFKGNIDGLRIYDSILNNFNVRYLYLNKYDFSDLVWNIPTGIQNYIEEVSKFFKFKLAGQKSQYYNINLVGLQIEDENLRIIMENIIKNTIKKVAPAYTELYKINWK